MAPVPLEREPSYVPLAVSGVHISLAIYLSYVVGASIYTSYKSLPPSQDTRERLLRRKRLAPVFAVLAVVALSFATYSTASYATLSYKVWADQRGVELPEHYFGDKAVFPTYNNASQVQLVRWLSDTPVYYDVFEIIAEKARRFWWGQQIDLATISWSMLLAIEGRRRRIPLLSAFMALSHLVSLSYAQNLFYLALLLTPLPIPSDEDLELPVAPLDASRWARIRESIFPAKPNNWCPHPTLFLLSMMLNLGALSLLPSMAGTSSFHAVALVARVFTFLPLWVPVVVPVGWGTVHPHPHNAYSSFTTLFKVLSVSTFILHAKASVLGLVYNTPDSHYHRHSRFLPWDVEERTTWERSTTALGKVLGSTADHPAVAAVGWDVLISTISLGTWAAVRATDVNDVLRSMLPFYDTKAPSVLAGKAEVEVEHDGSSLTRAGKHKKGAASVSSVANDDDKGSLTKRKGGRPKKKQAEEEETYEPTPDEARELVEGDKMPTEEMDWESAALAWGLTAFGGLGAASAGVFGAECIAR